MYGSATYPIAESEVDSKLAFRSKTPSPLDAARLEKFGTDQINTYEKKKSILDGDDDENVNVRGEDDSSDNVDKASKYVRAGTGKFQKERLNTKEHFDEFGESKNFSIRTMHKEGIDFDPAKTDKLP